MNKKSNRKEQILQALALELEQRPGKRITTANLAKAVGVSEAALYRHFPSKAKMFEALIELEIQLRQVLREGEIKGQLICQGNISQFAELLSSFIEGQLSQYVRSQFIKQPNEKWADKWQFFARSITSEKSQLHFIDK